MMFPFPWPLRLARRLFLPAALALMPFGCGAAEDEPPEHPITSASQQALWWGDFAALERQNALYRLPGHVEPDGRSQLDLFRKGIGSVFNASVKNAEPYLKELDVLTLQWAKTNPRSALAHALHARSLLAHGESYRGTSWAKDVPPEAWKFYHSYLQQAAVYIKDHAEVALTDSYTHYILLRVGKGLSWDDKQMAAIAQDGLKRNPDDRNLHSTMVQSLLPKWGGNARDLDAYIRQAAEQSRAKHGWALYAQLYTEAMEAQFGYDLFENSHADWDKMKQGFEDFLARYPESAEQRNRYAYVACIAKDKPTLLRLLNDIGARVDTSAWGKNPERALETCRRWATQT